MEGGVGRSLEAQGQLRLREFTLDKPTLHTLYLLLDPGFGFWEKEMLGYDEIRVEYCRKRWKGCLYGSMRERWRIQLSRRRECML